jgi:hypothetical protein
MTKEERTKIRNKMHKTYNERLKDISKLLNLYKEDLDAYDDELGNLNEYGLSLDKNSERRKGFSLLKLPKKSVPLIPSEGYTLPATTSTTLPDLSFYYK